MADFEIENNLIAQGYKLIAGVDEAGRGPLAGPVFAASVILPDNFDLKGIDDSKKLTEKKREMLFELIKEQSVAYAIDFVDNDDIDSLNIRNASFAAMAKSVNALSVQPDYVLIDGNAVKWVTLPHSCIVKGDQKSVSIAAASILAKVARDRAMLELDKVFPEYNFAKHKGYPTKEHYEALRRFGASRVHRKSFNLKLGDQG